MRAHRLVGVFCGFAFAVATPAALAEQPLQLRIGWAVAPAQLTPLLFEKKELPRHYGRSYTVKLVHFAGTPPQITAFATKELEIANLAFSSFGLAIQNAHMQDIRVVADVVQDGAPGHYSDDYLVLANSGIARVEDLKGKVLASNAFGAAIDIALRKMLRDHGLEDKRDYTMVEVAFPNTIAAIEEKKIALAGLPLPFSSVAASSGKFRTLFTMRDAMGPVQLTFLVMHAPFIAAHRAQLVDFLEDVQRATHWYLDPKNRAEALGIVARFTKAPVSEFADWLFTQRDFYRDPNARPDLGTLQQNIDLQRKMGFLHADIDVTRYADLSLVDEAARRLH
ncbi:MAG: ABC transporter substrate-binding protein [Terriglobia bacterium]